MSFTDDLTLLLSVEARDKATAIIDRVSGSLTHVSEQLTGVSASSNKMNADFDRALGGAAGATERLTAQTSRLETAELQAKLAARELADANIAMADGSAGAFERQQVALDSLTAADSRYAAAQREVAATTAQIKDAELKQAAAAEEASAKSTMLSGAFNKVGLGALGASVGIGLIAKNAVGAAVSFQSATVTIANNANISTQAANNIANAFVDMSGKTTFGAQDIATAYGKVAGVLKLNAGHALSTKEAIDFMDLSMKTAEASGQSLTATTGALSKMMLAFGMPTRSAAEAADSLYNASRMTGQSLPQLANQLSRMKGQLGVLAPSISDTTTFMVDLAKHGISNTRQVTTLLNTTMNKLLQTSHQVTPTTANVAKAFQSLPKPMQALAQEYENGTITADQYKKQLQSFPQAFQTYGSSFKSLVDKSQQSSDVLNALKLNPVQEQLSQLGVHVFNATGNFVGMRSVIDQLSPKINALHGNQAKLNALYPIFGQNSRKLLGVIEGGTKSWDKYNKAIMNSEARQKAAERASTSYKGAMEKVHSAISGAQIAIGNALLPTITSLINKFVNGLQPIIDWITHNKKLAGTIVEVVGGITLLIGGLYGVVKVSNAVGGTFSSIGKAAVMLAEKLGLMAGANEALTATEVEAGAAADVMATGFAAADTAGAPFILIGLAIVAAIALIVAAVYELLTHWSTVWGAVKSVALSFWHFLDNNVIHPIAEAFSWVYHNAILPFVHFVTAAFDVLKSVFMVYIGVIHFFVQTWWAIFMFLLHDVVEPIMTQIGHFFMWVWNTLIAPIVSWINSNIIQPIGGYFSWLWHSIIEPVMQGIADTVKSGWHMLVSIATWVGSHVIDPIVGLFASLGSSIGGAISDVSGIVTGVFRGIWNTIATGWNDSIGAIPGVPHMSMWNDGGSPAPMATVDASLTWSHRGLTPPGTKPGRASGGPVLAGMPYANNELGGDREVFVPNSAGSIVSGKFAGRNGGDGGGNVIVHVTMSGQVYGSLNDFANALGSHLATNMLPAGGVIMRH